MALRTPDDALPTRDEALAALRPGLAQHHGRVQAAMRRLRPSPPQVLLLEGGLDDERLGMALWYAALLNCPQEDAPCLHCPTCLQIGAGVYRDLYVLDGRDSTIKIDDVRELRTLIAEAPRGGGIRVIILAEAQGLSPQAANALLKSLEEPRPGNAFLLLAPQRERLLPTLVSRSWSLTLAWPEVTLPLAEHLRPWAEALAGFLRSGQGWFELTSVRGAVDAHAARQVILVVQKALAAVSGERNAGALGAVLAELTEAERFMAGDILAKAQESLDFAVNPALLLDWAATRLFVLVQSTLRRQNLQLTS